MAVASGLGLLGFFVPLSYDEAFWTAISRMVGTGRTLYVDAVDNKAPLVYVIVAIIDKLPGDLVAARSLTVGVLMGSLAYVCQRIGEQSGMSRESAVSVALISTGLVALLTGMTLTTELPTILALLGATFALCRDKPGFAILLGLTACGIDPRSVVLLPGIVLFAALDGRVENARKAGILLALFVLLGLLTVLSISDLRFALVELNYASRNRFGDWSPIEQIAIAAAALLPMFLVLRAAGGVRIGRASAVTLVPGVALAAASVGPVPHYWALAIPGLFFALTERKSFRLSRQNVAIIGFALVPLVAFSWVFGRNQARTIDEYEAGSAFLAAQDGSFASFDLAPYLSLDSPATTLLRAPSVNYLMWNTSRQADFVAELDEILTEAEILAEGGGLSAPRDRVYSPLRPVWDIFQMHLPRFPCRANFGVVTLWFRSEYCDSAG